MREERKKSSVKEREKRDRQKKKGKDRDIERSSNTDTFALVVIPEMLSYVLDCVDSLQGFFSKATCDISLSKLDSPYH